MPEKSKPWSKFWPAAVPESLDYPEVPLHELLRKSAKTHPEQAAIVYFEREITYATLDLLSDQFAAALAALGVKKGDKVAVFLPNKHSPVCNRLFWRSQGWRSFNCHKPPA